MSQKSIDFLPSAKRSQEDMAADAVILMTDQLKSLQEILAIIRKWKIYGPTWEVQGGVRDEAERDRYQQGTQDLESRVAQLEHGMESIENGLESMKESRKLMGSVVDSHTHQLQIMDDYYSPTDRA